MDLVSCIHPAAQTMRVAIHGARFSLTLCGVSLDIIVEGIDVHHW